MAALRAKQKHMVKDVRMKIMVSVKQEHIDRGCPQNSRICPIALAFRDIVRKDVNVSVSTGLAALSYIGEDKQNHCAAVYHAARSKIIGFDVNGKMEPFDMEVDIPQDYLKEVENG